MEVQSSTMRRLTIALTDYHDLLLPWLHRPTEPKENWWFLSRLHQSTVRCNLIFINLWYSYLDRKLQSICCLAHSVPLPPTGALPARHACGSSYVCNIAVVPNWLRLERSFCWRSLSLTTRQAAAISTCHYARPAVGPAHAKQGPRRWPYARLAAIASTWLAASPGG